MAADGGQVPRAHSVVLTGGPVCSLNLGAVSGFALRKEASSVGL